MVRPMTQPAVIVEDLPAAYGDSLLATCSLKHGPWRLLVDTGTDECWPSLKARLAQLPVVDGTRHIDLAVITHIDHDHIGAAGLMLSDTSLGLKFGDIWFNAPPQPEARGVKEGRTLASILGGTHAKLPWNLAWCGKPAVTTTDMPFMELPANSDMPKITLLSPNPQSLATLFKVWDAELKKLGKSETPPAELPARRVGPLDLEALANKITATDRAPANGSSIAILLEHRDASVLLCADAHPTVLAPALRALAVHRRLPAPL